MSLLFFRLSLMALRSLMFGKGELYEEPKGKGNFD